MPNRRRFITDLAGSGAVTKANRSQGCKGHSSDDDSDREHGDDEHTVGPFAKKRKKMAPQHTKVAGTAASPSSGGDSQRQLVGTLEAAPAAGPAGQGVAGRGRGGRGDRGKPALIGLQADFPRSNLIPVASEEEKGRGGRGRGGRSGGRQPTAFNPYDIPDEFLMKGGKRSAVMPRSGNRSSTFK